MTVDTPVVAVVYHRPERAAELLAMLRAVRPRMLFLAADGPRPDDDGDRTRCDMTRAVATAVDWPCDLVVDFSDEHLGCARRVVSAIDHAFTRVDRAIVLEEDVRATPSFFSFCDAMLERYADDERIMHVDGANRLGEWRPDAHDYHFARHGHVWGWATWARAWANFDITLERHRTPAARAAVGQRALDPPHRALLEHLLDTDLATVADAWDYQWSLSRAATGGLAVVPARNLTTNVGFGADATHTLQADELAASTRAFTLAPPYSGPVEVVADDDLDRELLRFERLRGLREATVPLLLRRALADPRVRDALAPDPLVANALAVFDDPDAASALLRALARTGEPSAIRDQLIDEFARLQSAAP